MSYNGSGTFNINSAGQPVVTGTVITSTAFNLLTADLATGLTTALTKDGQTTPTANIPLGGFKITGLGAGTLTTDAVRLSQLQSVGTTTYITAAGTDTITGTVTPTLTAYATGQQFSFVVAATNTAAVTLNINSLGAKAVTRTGSVALVAGDMVIGQVVIVEYDGTRFQLINGNSFTNLKVSGTLGVTGVATLGTGAILGTPASATLTNATGLPISTGVSGLGTGVATFLATPSSANLAAAVTGETGTGALVFATSPALVTPALGTPASGVVTNLTGTASININGTVGATTPTTGAFTTLSATGVATFAAGTAALPSITTTGDTNTGIYFPAADTIAFTEGGAEAMRLDSSGNLLFNSGYGSVATAYGCRVWVNFNGTGTPAIRASGNVSSITDNGTGEYTVNFTTSMPDANFSCVANAINDGVANAVAVPNVSSTGSVSISTVETTALTTAADVNKIYAAIFH